MEPIIIDSQPTETQPAQLEAQKKRKYTKKKAENAPAKPTKEEQPVQRKEAKEEIRTELIHYANKLEFELISAKQKLKKQRKYFKSMMNSIVNCLGESRVTKAMIDEYVTAIGLDLNEEENDSNFEKLFTVHKYRVIEENKANPQEQKKVGKKISDGKILNAGPETEEVIVMQTSIEKPKKKKEKKEEAGGEAKPRKKKEKKKVSSDEHNANSNSTAPTVAEDGHEAKEITAKKEDKSHKEFIQIEDEPSSTKQQKDKNLNPNIGMMQAPQPNPALPFMQLYNTMLQKELPNFNKLFTDMMNNSSQLPPQFMDLFKGNVK